MGPETRQCQNCKSEFTIEPEDFEFYSRMKVPAPTFCPECRNQRRMVFRNERSLYKRKCGLCEKDIISMYSPDKPHNVYCAKCYWSDKWDPYEYGMDYNSSRQFFEQFKELQEKVPLLSLVQDNAVNSDWVNWERDAKNCYLDVGGEGSEDSAYNTYALWSKDCFDSYWVENSELGYELIKTEKCYKSAYSFWCFDCQGAWFSYDCSGCSNIIGCAGLRRKSYHIFNKPVSKEEYENFVKENLTGSRKKIKELIKKAEEIKSSVPHRDSFIEKSIGSSGNFIINSKNCVNCWDVGNIEDSKHAYVAKDAKNVYDVYATGWGELAYEVFSCGEPYDVRFGYIVWRGARGVDYSHHIFGTNNCFGSVGLKKGEQVILNKRYSKEDYEKLRAQIIEDMNQNPYTDKAGHIYKYGEFFPPELSPFGYNETVAQDYLVLDKQEAKKGGFNWSDYEADNGVKPSDYSAPDNIRDVKDYVLEKVLADEKTGKPYRIIKMELDFYRKMNLPIPTKAPLTRHKERLAKIPLRKLYDQTCKKCGKETKSVYSPESGIIVYCEGCYKAEVA